MNSSGPTDKPVRRDVARNRARILEAAGELFAQRGLSVHLNDIAKHAGVGVGTVYRHFPDKEKLIETLFEARVHELVAIGEEGLADPDPWHGLVRALERGLEMQSADRGLRELVHDSPESLERAVRVRSRLLPMAEQAIARAQAAGAVREDIVATDIPLIQLMIGSVIDAAREVDPQLWRRYLALALRGIAAEPAGMSLETGPVSPEDMDQVMTRAPRRPGR